MRFIERHDVVRASFVLLALTMHAAINGCGGDIPIGSDASGGSSGTGGAGVEWGMGGTGSTATASGTSTTSGCPTSSSASTSTSTGSGGPIMAPVLIAVLDDATGYYSCDPMFLLQNDLLTVIDPASPDLPLLRLSGLCEDQTSGTWRAIATSKNKKRLAVTELYREQATLRVFDENLQQLVNVTLPNGGSAVYPTEQAIFAASNGTIVKLDSNGSYVGSASAIHGPDLVVDEDRQVVWAVGKSLTRIATDLSNEQVLYTFANGAGSLDLDADGGIWAAEFNPIDVPCRLVHFDVNGNIINGDTLPILPASQCISSVRVDRNSGRVWIAMGGPEGGAIAYRDDNGQLMTVPGLPAQRWHAVEPDPLDGSRAWVAGRDGQVFHIDTNGTIIQSIAGGLFSKSAQKWLAVMLPGP